MGIKVLERESLLRIKVTLQSVTELCESGVQVVNINVIMYCMKSIYNENCLGY